MTLENITTASTAARTYRFPVTTLLKAVEEAAQMRGLCIVLRAVRGSRITLEIVPKGGLGAGMYVETR